MARENLSLMVSRQLPEFVREDYPTFVAFVEAYYEYMRDQGVDFDKVRDIDQTLDEFVVYFKKQLAVNLPIVVEDERMLLQHIKDQYLAKGSEGSFKLLFRLLFGKNVELSYPGQQMLIASDGSWNQEISVFVDVDYGDPNDIIGQLVDISSGDRVLSVLIDRKEELIGEVDRVRAIGNDVYEIFLDKRFFGEIQPGDKIRYKDQFQAEILPATTTLTITQPGKNFRVGQVFALQSGEGTQSLVKITSVGVGGGINKAEFIKFGIGYVADFAVSILADNSVTDAQRRASAATSRSITDLGGGNYQFNQSISDRNDGFSEQGYINRADYFSTTYMDATFAGTILREFALSSANAQTNSDDPAVIEINLGALNRYPGFFETNAGFLSDSIYIQDSKYYQKFSYVLRIDERLKDYSSAVKTMVHPSGMRLFGEYDITNDYNLELELESLVKSLGITLGDNAGVEENGITWNLTKPLSDEAIIDDSAGVLLKALGIKPSDSFSLTDDDTIDFSKALSDSITTPDDSDWIHDTNKALADSFSAPDDTVLTYDLSVEYTDTSIITDNDVLEFTKYTTDSINTPTISGEVWANSYQGQDYYSDDYSVGLQETF